MSLINRLTITHPQRVFWITWFGQLISLIGSGLTSFAVGAYIFETTRSTTQFSLMTFFYFTPMVLLAPVAGALIDRWDRRRAMLLADLGSGLGTTTIFLLVMANKYGALELKAWYFYAPISVMACFSAFRWPAFFATVSLLVPKEHLGRANAVADIASNSAQIVSPMIAGVLVASVGLDGVILADMGSFCVAVTTLLLVRFPRPPPSKEGQAGRGSLSQEIRLGWTFIRSRPGLVGLLGFTAMTNFIMCLVTLLITPLVLAFTDIETLGRIASIAGLGGLAGGIAMSVWGGPKRLVVGMIAFHSLSGLVLFLAAPLPSVVVVSVAAALYLACVPPVSASSQALWQRKIPADLQGRASAAKRLIILCAPPLAGLIAGPLADHLFEPWMMPGGLLADSFGRLLGVGPGRGIALLFIGLGLLAILNSLVAWLNPRVRHVQAELPDALPDAPAPATASPAEAPAPLASASGASQP